MCVRAAAAPRAQCDPRASRQRPHAQLPPRPLALAPTHSIPAPPPPLPPAPPRHTHPHTRQTINLLGKKARDGTLSIDEMAGGTFTISNGGVFGSMLSTPIINPPQSAILGMHATNMKPAVVGGQIMARWVGGRGCGGGERGGGRAKGAALRCPSLSPPLTHPSHSPPLPRLLTLTHPHAAPHSTPTHAAPVLPGRPMMYLALTYDHRLIDGREAVTFLKRVKEVIEDPRRLLLDV